MCVRFGDVCEALEGVLGVGRLPIWELRLFWVKEGPDLRVDLPLLFAIWDNAA